MRRLTTSNDVQRDTIKHRSLETPKQKFNTLAFDHRQLDEIRLNQSEPSLTSNPNIESPINGYFTVQYPRHPQPTPGLLMTSYHALVPRYPSWSWLPGDSSLYYLSPHEHAHSPRMTSAQRQTWNHSSLPGYSNNTQQVWSMGEPAPRSPKELGRGIVPKEDSPWRPGTKLAKARYPSEVRQKLKLMPVIREFFSVEDVVDSKSLDEARKPREKNIESLSQQQDFVHNNNQSFSTWDVEGRPEAKPDSSIKETKDCSPSFSQEQEAEKRHNCKECGKHFRQLGNLTRHVVTHNSEKSNVCPQCNKTFNRASNLHTHMQIHSSYKPHKCDFCGKSFHQKIDKRIHHYTHTGEKPYKCQKCGRGFKQLTHLNYHMRTHSDEHMYHCPQCGKGFNQKGNLQAHIYGHTGERPFKCEICGKGFTLRSTLNTHIRTHANTKPFVCEYCNKAFYQKNSLKMHHIASHPTVNGKSIL